MTNDKQIAKVLEHLRLAAEDPMWADHAEVPKALCAAAADEIERLRMDLENTRVEAALAVSAARAAERERCASIAENYDLGTPEGHAIARCIRGVLTLERSNV